MRAARALFEHLLAASGTDISVRLWDGTQISVGRDRQPRFSIVIHGPGTLGAIARWPTLETVARQYALGRIEIVGGSLIEFLEVLRQGPVDLGARAFLKPTRLVRSLPLLWARDGQSGPVLEALPKYSDEAPGRQSSHDRAKNFVRFHYDISNDFYKLFLDSQMVYSCGYFTDWDNSIEQAQADKLDMICRKLRLAPGERFLDIGCGWGALVCHAAGRYGVVAHGVTLSPAQHEYANARVEALGLADRVTVELRDYATLEGTYDKIASIGMYEHIGIANYPAYFGKIFHLLRDRGLLLNHGITSPAMTSRRRFRKIGPTRRLILKYIFPGSELDHIGHTMEVMEAGKFEIHDVEGWRRHYAQTCRLWHERLIGARDEAIGIVGGPRYRMWLAYLAGVSLAFADGTLEIFQTLVSKHQGKGFSQMPPTRAHLYRPAQDDREHE